jgi:4-hydroxy-tetrahydrodipicolinate synthase
MDKLVQGVYAALLTPRRTDDSVDETAFASLIEFLFERDLTSFAINGATGEFCLTAPHHLRSLFSVLHKTSRSPNILCGVGAAGAAQTLELAKIAQGEGARALLLPMPYFFPYRQEDLEAFVQTVAASVSLPILLYNLPDFTTCLEPETSCRLIRDVPNVIGIKDSGKSLNTLRQLTASGSAACRIVGNDAMLAAALGEGLCDGVVSGVACVLPELIRAVFNCGIAADAAALSEVSGLLDSFIQQLSSFPVPWGLKWIAEARGILKASFSQPVSTLRLEQGRVMAEWYGAWRENILPAVLSGKQ